MPKNKDAVQAWNLMGGELNWSAIEAVLEYIGVSNIDDCIYAIDIIRDFSNKLREAK